MHDIKFVVNQISDVIHQALKEVFPKNTPADLLEREAFIVERTRVHHTDGNDYYSTWVLKVLSKMKCMSMLQDICKQANESIATLWNEKGICGCGECEDVHLADMWNISLMQNGFLSLQLKDPYRYILEEDYTQESQERKLKRKREPSADNIDEKDNSYITHAIGFFESVFKEKFGTPRQPSLCVHTRGRVRICNHIDMTAFQDLTDYSHVWIMFQFHKNTNKNFSTKVKPPRLNGQKTGTYATRSPHRINPIGLSVCKLESININEHYIEVSGIDIIQDTPIIDIKPYHPADCVPNATYPSWVTTDPKPNLKVTFANDIWCNINIELLEFYDDMKDIEKATEEVLKQDPRTLHSCVSHKNGMFAFQLDKLDIAFQMINNENENASQTAHVFSVKYRDDKKPGKTRLRTKAWLESLSTLSNM